MENITEIKKPPKKKGGKKGNIQGSVNLRQVWADPDFNKFGTEDLAEYEGKLDEMNLSDLQTHATKVGVIPRADRVRLKKDLLKSFKIYQTNARVCSGRVQKPQRKRQERKEKNLSKEVLSIMAEGR